MFSPTETFVKDLRPRLHPFCNNSIYPNSRGQAAVQLQEPETSPRQISELYKSRQNTKRRLSRSG
jgi:hypothetical protein